MFGVNAELLIDHAWGYEPCTMKMVKAYKPETNSVCSGQVLHCPYDFEKAKLVVKEMTDQMVLELVDKKLVTDQIVLTVGYDIENLNNTDRKKKYHGEVTIDRYGRRIPKHAHGTTNLKRQTSSTKLITDAVIELYDRIVDRNLLIRRINITANRLVDENSVKKEKVYEQLDLFTDYEAQRKKQEEEEAALDREKRMQEAMLSIKKKFGKNAVLNYLLLLGWAPEGEQEIFSLDEMIKIWDPARISKSPAIFDPLKLRAINAAYIRALPAEEFRKLADPFIDQAVHVQIDRDLLCANLQPRCEVLEDIPPQLDFFDAVLPIDAEMYRNKKQKTTPESAKEALSALLPVLEAQTDWSRDAIFEACKQKAEAMEKKNGWLLFPLGIALSGKARTPGGGTDLAAMMGKEETLRRLNAAIEAL